MSKIRKQRNLAVLMSLLLAESALVVLACEEDCADGKAGRTWCDGDTRKECSSDDELVKEDCTEKGARCVEESDPVEVAYCGFPAEDCSDHDSVTCVGTAIASCFNTTHPEFREDCSKKNKTCDIIEPDRDHSWPRGTCVYHSGGCDYSIRVMCSEVNENFWLLCVEGSWTEGYRCAPGQVCVDIPDGGIACQ